MAHHSIVHEGRRTCYRLEDRGGDRAGVVCVHGSGATHAAWARQFRLAKNRPIAAVDLSGHGESEDIEADPGWETLSAYTSDVMAVVRQVQAKFLVGHSMGAAVTLDLLDRRDPVLDGIVLIGMGTRLPVHRDILQMASHNFDELVDFLHAPGRFFYDPDPALIAASQEAMLSCGPDITRRDLLTCDRIDFRDRLSHIEVPVYVLCGEHDRLTPPEANADLASALPNGSMQRITNAAHVPMLERPDETNQHLSDFFDDPSGIVD